MLLAGWRACGRLQPSRGPSRWRYLSAPHARAADRRTPGGTQMGKPWLACFGQRGGALRVLMVQDEAHQLLAALGVRLAELAACLPDLGALDLQMLDVPYVGSHAQLGATGGAEEELELRARHELL